MKRLILFLVIGMIGFIGHSQIEIKNKVVDFQSFLPLENCSVYVKNTTIGTVTNEDGKFVLLIPEKHQTDTLIVSNIGYKSYKIPVNEFDDSMEIILEEDIASLNEVLLVADTRPETANEIIERALERLPRNLPESPYLQKGFIRHKERNKREFKWLIESAITLYDSSFPSGANENIKINVDQVRKSYDLRDVDSLLVYTSYLKNHVRNFKMKSRNLKRDTIRTSSLVKAIRWNDGRVNGLENLFKGKLNLVRNSHDPKALFGENMLESHQFELDTILVDNERKIYKIKIEEGNDFVDLHTKGIFNNGFQAQGWIYVYWDNYAIKKIEYELVAASDAQKSRSKTLFDTYLNHKLELSYMEYDERMYLNYIYYETPKLVNVGDKSNQDNANNDERYYYTVQEVLFTEIVVDPEEVQEQIVGKSWDADMFSPKPYDKSFWKSYNTLLESEEEEKLIEDLTQKYSLYKE
ncbi:carboxypeptidase-like regulatory domain-containing protein [Mangrovimonas sp. CR14]|uniref:carboxypeptidase-like regulatory domain-containing protein n=1 Tax=Mangrovimonas sp. CR14 TaxID=2706120 RepID=UPI001424A0F4|nr:carboxypeptidase-like regulatory domain-containing protein [Mangrovimonas sp. CR14]NIK92382.1 carboxypeptidase-like regulatory domain-containing protein [Mangrovimonas sp. CR14]